MINTFVATVGYVFSALLLLTDFHIGHASFAFPQEGCRRQKKRKRQPTTLLPVSLGLRTQYTIDETICAPTRPHLLEKAVSKSCKSLPVFLSRKPIARHTQQAFEQVLELIGDETLHSKPILLDSGCGTGRSTKILAEKYPESWVIGVDRSFARLSKNQASETIETVTEKGGIGTAQEETSKRPFCKQVSNNCFLVRAELVDFWRCCHEANLFIRDHYLLYPNPYPTHTRLTQRWYAHPSFPLLLQLGSKHIIVRSNWKVYLEEFAQSVKLASAYYEAAGELNPVMGYTQGIKGPLLRSNYLEAWTNFEEKYDSVGELTYELSLENIQ